ncbi:MAG TPA: thiamine diphosphokinase [Candidatus Ozemobacteraceae bacterium]|nr:thiamine diphosphokinase [Candidatus Ozemobacteraceae bacterium]
MSEQRKTRRILIAAGGSPDQPPPGTAWDLIIAVDHGGDLLRTWNLDADTVIGDLDSLSPEALKHHLDRGAEVVRYSADKNETDLELALRSLPNDPHAEIYLTNLWGGRFDHSIMNLLMMSHFTCKGLLVFPTTDGIGGIMSAGQLAVAAPHHLGTALIALSSEVTGISSHGVQWPLQKETLRFGESRGVSNRLIRSPWRLQAHTGTLLWLISGVSRAAVEIEWLPAVL